MVVSEFAESPEIVELLAELRRSAPALTRMVAKLAALEESGGLDALLELVQVLQAAKVSMTDGMIARLSDAARVAMELMDVLMISGMPDRAPALLKAAMEARDAAAADPERVSPLDFLAAPKEPEIQFMLKFMLAMARRLPAAMQG